MPGPTSKGTYVGRSLGASLGAALEKRAATRRSDPPCEVCARPMCVGQDRSNGGAHFACRPSAAAFDRLSSAGPESCRECWAAHMVGAPLDHAAHVLGVAS